MPNKGLLRPGAGPELEGPGAGYQHILSTYNGNQEGTPRGLHPHSPEPISGSPGAGKWEEWAWGLGQITPSHKAPGGGGTVPLPLPPTMSRGATLLWRTHLPVPPPPRAVRMWSAGTCWTQSAESGRRWPSRSGAAC